MEGNTTELVELDPSTSIWERCFTVFPLVVVGTLEEDGAVDLAPKHLAMPLSWENHFGFVCSRTHRTSANAERTGVFTVTYARPEQTVLAALAATPRCEDGSKPITAALPTRPAEKIDGVFLDGGYLFLECVLDAIHDGYGANCLISGRIVAARVAGDALRRTDEDEDDQDLLRDTPLLAYLYPGRFAEITATQKLPFPQGFRR